MTAISTWVRGVKRTCLLSHLEALCRSCIIACGLVIEVLASFSTSRPTASYTFARADFTFGQHSSGLLFSHGFNVTL